MWCLLIDVFPFYICFNFDFIYLEMNHQAFSDQADGYFRSISSVETSRLSSEDAIETIFWDIVTARKSLEEKLAWVSP